MSPHISQTTFFFNLITQFSIPSFEYSFVTYLFPFRSFESIHHFLLCYSHMFLIPLSPLVASRFPLLSFMLGLGCSFDLRIVYPNKILFKKVASKPHSSLWIQHVHWCNILNGFLCWFLFSIEHTLSCQEISFFYYWILLLPILTLHWIVPYYLTLT